MYRHFLSLNFSSFFKQRQEKQMIRMSKCCHRRSLGLDWLKPFSLSLLLRPCLITMSCVFFFLAFLFLLFFDYSSVSYIVYWKRGSNSELTASPFCIHSFVLSSSMTQIMLYELKIWCLFTLIYSSEMTMQSNSIFTVSVRWFFLCLCSDTDNNLWQSKTKR